MAKKKAKRDKPRNFVAKHMHEFSRARVEEDKRKKDAKHKARETEPFSLVKFGFTSFKLGV